MRTAAVNMLEATVVKNEETAVAALWQVNHENVRKGLVRPYARYGKIGILRGHEEVETAAENQNAVPAAEWRAGADLGGGGGGTGGTCPPLPFI